MKPQSLFRWRAIARRVPPVLVASLFAGAMSFLPAKGEVWTVDNNPGHLANFTTLQQANDDSRVHHGDVLLIAGSQTVYPGVILTKKLTIFGTGYYLAENQPPVNSYASSTINGEIVFSSLPGNGFDPPTSSAGSVVMGLNQVNFSVQVNDVTVQRCAGGISVNNVNNLSVLQCMIDTIAGGGGTYVSGVNNLVIANCFIKALRVHSSVNGAVIQNNVFKDQIIVQTSDSSVSNNILLFADSNQFVMAGILKNNMLAAPASYLPAGNGNMNFVNPASVFVPSGTTDGKWQLKEGSLAAGVGLSGEDLGMFGGNTPYVLSGLPPIPTVVLDTSATGTGPSGLKIHVQAHAHN